MSCLQDSDADIEKECAERFEVDAEEAIAVLRSENKTISEAIMVCYMSFAIVSQLNGFYNTPIMYIHLYTLQCYAKCWMEKHELFEEDGSINLEKGYESFKKHGEKKSVENDDKEKASIAHHS